MYTQANEESFAERGRIDIPLEGGINSRSTSRMRLNKLKHNIHHLQADHLALLLRNLHRQQYGSDTGRRSMPPPKVDGPPPQSFNEHSGTSQCLPGFSPGLPNSFMFNSLYSALPIPPKFPFPMFSIRNPHPFPTYPPPPIPISPPLKPHPSFSKHPPLSISASPSSNPPFSFATSPMLQPSVSLPIPSHSIVLTLTVVSPVHHIIPISICHISEVISEPCGSDLRSSCRIR
jgi:hypothetical protein